MIYGVTVYVCVCSALYFPVTPAPVVWCGVYSVKCVIYDVGCVWSSVYGMYSVRVGVFVLPSDACTIVPVSVVCLVVCLPLVRSEIGVSEWISPVTPRSSSRHATSLTHF